jgi:hypothetical protein
MTFFNRKEEVLDIQLTQYGKQLLAKGIFKPAYYQFFDDDIVYDIEYADLPEEAQKDIQNRIKESPRLHTQYTFVSPEADLKKAVEQFRSKKKGSFTDIYVPDIIAQKIMSQPLANAEYGNRNAPAWSIGCLRGKISQAVTNETGLLIAAKRTRLILEDSEYIIESAKKSVVQNYVPGDVLDTVSDVGLPPTSDLNNLSSRFIDDSFIQVREDYILLDLQELNVQFNQENFDIELFEIVEDDSISGESLKQLYFNKKAQNIVNNILLDEQNSSPEYKPERLEMVEYYFNIQADREIDSRVLCKDLSDAEKKKLVATNQIDLECEELYGSLTDPRITSDVKVEDLLEKC